MKVVAVRNEKGGVGKSTLSATIAGGLAALGLRVVLLDTDPQGHAARILGMPEEDGLYRLLIDNVPWSEVLREVPRDRYAHAGADSDGRLLLLPSSLRTASIAALEQNVFALADRLDELGETFGFELVVIDTAPTASLFDSLVHISSDAFLYITELEALSFDGIRKSMQKVERISRKRQEYGSAPNHILGILPNKMRANTENHRMNVGLLAETYGALVMRPIKQRTKWTESSNYGQLVYTYAPGSGEAADAWEAIYDVERRMRAWLEN